MTKRIRHYIFSEDFFFNYPSEIEKIQKKYTVRKRIRSEDKALMIYQVSNSRFKEVENESEAPIYKPFFSTQSNKKSIVWKKVE